ncbi:hypothetical protein [Flavobacterium johnsoniae]|uniref:hypothetical protein n=1 Tax=Flavobacterium johnsoniae TaxID=986 RepID=UPI0011EF6A6C|nr:hypothetical protein [Flavobacterium johnsoniae]
MMFDIVSVISKHTAFLEDKLKQLDLNQRKSIGKAFIPFYFLLPETVECIEHHLKIKISESKLIEGLENNTLQYFKDALKNYSIYIDPYADDFEELEPIEIDIICGLENCINSIEKEEYITYNFLLLIDILYYYQDFSENPEYWNNLLKEEIDFQQKIVEQISNGTVIDESIYFERYKEVKFDEI